MGKTKPERPAHTSVFLVAELVHEIGSQQELVRLLISLPTSDAVKTCSWPLERGMITSTQLEDLSAHVSQLVTDAAVAWLGVQGDLPGV